MKKINLIKWCMIGNDLYIDSNYFHNDLEKELIDKNYFLCGLEIKPYEGLILGITKYNNVYLYDMNSCPIIEKEKK